MDPVTSFVLLGLGGWAVGKAADKASGGATKKLKHKVSGLIERYKAAGKNLSVDEQRVYRECFTLLTLLSNIGTLKPEFANEVTKELDTMEKITAEIKQEKARHRDRAKAAYKGVDKHAELEEVFKNVKLIFRQYELTQLVEQAETIKSIEDVAKSIEDVVKSTEGVVKQLQQGATAAAAAAQEHADARHEEAEERADNRHVEMQAQVGDVEEKLDKLLVERAANKLLKLSASVLARRCALDPMPVLFVADVHKEAFDKAKALMGEDSSAAHMVGLTAMGGAGKSWLALALANDVQVQSRFTDGVLWVDVGEDADLRALLANVWHDLGCTDELPNDMQAATKLVKQQLHSRRVLLVLDNVWEDAILHAFDVASECSQVLFTARPRHELDLASANEMVMVDVGSKLSDEETLALMGTYAMREVRDDELEDAMYVADFFGRLPQALAIVAKSLKRRKWANVAERLRVDGATRAGNDALEQVAAATDLSLSYLDDEACKGVYLQLGVLKKSARYSLLDLAMACGRAEEAMVEDEVAALVEASLVLKTDEDVYQLHDLLHDYICERHPANKADHARFVGAVGGEPWACTPYVLEHLVTLHLQALGDVAGMRRILEPEEKGKEWEEAKAARGLRSTLWPDKLVWRRAELDKATERGDKAEVGRAAFDLGKVLEGVARYDDALEHYGQALAILKEALGDKHPDVASTLLGIGNVYTNQGNNAKALEHYEQALTVRKEALGDMHSEVATTLGNMGVVYSEQGNYAKALEHYDQALTIQKEELGDKHPKVASTFGNMGNVYNRQGNNAKALEHYEQALAIQKEALGDRHLDVAMTRNNMGSVYIRQGNNAKALEHYDQALTIQKEELGDKHPKVASTFGNMGNVYNRQGNNAKALEHYEQALAIEKEALGDTHPGVASTLLGMGNVYNHQGNYAKALENYGQALTIQKGALGDKHPEVALTLGNMGIALKNQGNYAKALEHYEQSLAIRKEALGDKHPHLASTLHNMGTVYSGQGNYAKALEHYEQALAIWKEALGDKHPDVATTLGNMGTVYSGQGNYAKALKYLEQALAVTKEALGNTHPNVAEILGSIGTTYTKQGDYAKAISHLEPALAIMKEALGDTHPLVATILGNMGTVYSGQGNNAKALEFNKQALAIMKAVNLSEHPAAAKLQSAIEVLSAAE